MNDIFFQREDNREELLFILVDATLKIILIQNTKNLQQKESYFS